MPNVLRGKAQVEGVPGAFDVILYPSTESLKLSHEIEEDIIQDTTGSDMAWRSRNEKVLLDVTMFIVDKTGASSLANAKTGGAFLAPYAVVTLSTFQLAVFNTTWQIISGASIDLQNTNTGKIAYKLRRYVDSTQNTLAAASPNA